MNTTGFWLVERPLPKHSNDIAEASEARALQCAHLRAKTAVDRAEQRFWHAAALANSGRGTQRAVADARAGLDAARAMLRRAEFALAEAKAAFGPLPRVRRAQC
ncbi:MAG: hypothetical protein AB3N09_02395 [Tateyamaria sp.]